MADDLVNDARLEGYGGGKGILDVGGATYYLLTGALGVLAVSVMFKDAKRANAKK
jgi:glucose dehydrogenase